MTLENQIRALEEDLIVVAEIKAPMEKIELKLSEIKAVTEKLLGITNEYKEDKNENT